MAASPPPLVDDMPARPAALLYPGLEEVYFSVGNPSVETIRGVLRLFRPVQRERKGGKVVLPPAGGGRRERGGGPRVTAASPPPLVDDMPARPAALLYPGRRLQ